MRMTLRCALALAVLCATLAPVQATTITTSTYDATSTSDDVAVSCQQLKINSSTGVIDATCNKSTDNGISGNGSKLDMDTVVYCKTTYSAEGNLDWGTSSYTGSIGSWTIHLDSTGDDYVVTATCKMDGQSGSHASSIDIGDVTRGLKNDGGDLVKR